MCEILLQETTITNFDFIQGKTCKEIKTFSLTFHLCGVTETLKIGLRRFHYAKLKEPALMKKKSCFNSDLFYLLNNTYFKRLVP